MPPNALSTGQCAEIIFPSVSGLKNRGLGAYSKKNLVRNASQSVEKRYFAEHSTFASLIFML